jgi:hypothetical protein
MLIWRKIITIIKLFNLLLMEQKKSVIVEILRKMSDNGITFKDLQNEMASNPDLLMQKFDLLCLINGVPKRLSFEEGRTKNPIAIFPFASDWYLELAQDEGMLRHHVDESRLPDRDIWLEIYKLQDALNLQLRAMGQPELLGSYFARGGRLNWVVTFDGNRIAMPEDSCSSTKAANVRYCGML